MSLSPANLRLSLRAGSRFSMAGSSYIGARQISGAIALLLRETDQAVKRTLENKGWKVIPERTSRMITSFMVNMVMSALYQPQGMELGSDAPYAGYVNAFVPPINWTRKAKKTRIWYHWHDRMVQYALKTTKRKLREKIKSLGLNKTLGLSISKIANEFQVSF